MFLLFCMKKILYISMLLPLFGLLMAPALCSAAPNINEHTDNIARGSGYDAADSSDTALSVRIGQIISIAMTLVGTIFLALTVYAGFLWMTAQGNEENVTKATNILKMAVTGLIIVLAAYGITYFVVSNVGGSGSTTTSQVGTDNSEKGGEIFTSDFWSGFAEGFTGQMTNPDAWSK